METLRKQLSADIALNDDEKGFVATISNDVVDRDREVMLPDGLDASEFMTSGTIFFDHGGDPNVGRVPVAKPVALKRQGNSWKAKGIFAPRPESHPKEAEWFPDTLHHLIKFGAIRGTSVGFTPIESRRPTPKDRERFGDEVEKIFSKWKMTEFSITAQPANQEALIEAVSKGVITAERVKSMFHVELGKGKKPKPKPRKKVTIYVFEAKAPAPSYHKMISKAIKDGFAKHRGSLELEAR